ncbi:MAG TPA: hypothetical protein VFH95_10170 [Candidatus Kapabacteria bacterium]|nr:hypothetical protein [Candidatus Kapabacteria bacterium]
MKLPASSTILFALALSSFAIGYCLSGCANDPIVQERMVIAPDTIVFRSPVMDSGISITHTCSCPFSWSATVSPVSDTAWLTFPTYQSGDKKDVPISIDRAKLPADTNRAAIAIASNSYGTDTLVVIAIR